MPIPCHQKISIPGSTALQSTLHLKTWKKFLTLFFFFHNPYMKRIFIVERRHLQNKNRLPLHEDYSVYTGTAKAWCIEHKDVFITQVSNSQAEMEHG